MSFRVWFYFLILVGTIMIILWMLQITFLEPYYRINRESRVQEVINEVEKLMQDDPFFTQQTAELRTMFAKQDMCGAIYNESGVNIIGLANDVTGQSCYLQSITRTSQMEYINLIRDSKTKSINIPFRNEYIEQSMSFFGKQIHAGGETYYIFINTPMELLDSTVEILKNQFLVVSTVVFSLATGIAITLSRHLARPIVKMNQSARKLAEGDFSVVFKGEGYNEVIELSETLNYATEEFSKTDELRRDLVANVSHDIKTPLTMIKAYAEMIEDLSGNDPEQRSKHLGVIVDEVNHLERLVNDMLTLSKYESKVYIINESTFNLLEHIESTTNLFQGLDIEFVVQVDPDIMVTADEIKMGQVLYNFVNNATRHVGDDMTIIVKAELKNNEVLVSVIDHGIGIEEHMQSTIWDRYGKINKNHIRNETSTGLGLSIVKAICEATGSKYGVKSKRGEGACFYYTLKHSKEKQKIARGWY